MRRGISAILSSIFEERRKSRESLPLPEIELSASGSAGIYAPNLRTLIFESVLSRQTTAEPGRGAAPNDRKARTAGSVSRRIQVCEDLGSAKEAISQSGKTLALASDAATADYVGRLLQMTETQLCQIAFIGQMNAGKSTLINTLVGTPDLLPSEITPWTTVVTNLYFGIPNKPTGGAVFEFFNEAEWRQLSEGSGRVRALTEQLIPDFPWQSFHQQVDNLRQAAERRLGARYGELLGKQHTFDALTGGLLEKYVAAESPLGEEDKPSAGEYSMLTKAAHIYFDLGSFFYPTVLIDTPGINDPFLVRDEITRQNLERANIFVIVVTARQPLSGADLDLLRILRGLRKENFIIFVNKLDEIDEFDKHAEAITGRIKTLLKREFPDADIPIIIGCAEWAAVALGQDTARQRELAKEHNFPRSSALLDAEGAKSFWLSDPSAEAAALSDTILTRSGVPDLAATISQMLHSGSIAGSLKHTTLVLLVMAKNGLARAERNAELVSGLLTLPEGDATAVAKIDAELSKGLDEAGATSSSANIAIEQIRARYAGIIENTKDNLSQKLKEKIGSHLSSAESQLANLRDTASAGGRSIVIGLRSAIEAEFSQLFQEVLTQIGDSTLATEQELAGQIDAAARALSMRIEYPQLPALKCSPSLAALGEPIATELGGAAYSSSWAKLSSPEQKQTFLGLIETEFGAIADKLAQSGQEELERTTAFILEHFRSNVSRPLQLVIEERQALIANYSHLQAGDAETRQRWREHLKRRLKQIESDAGAYAQAATALASIKIAEKE